MSKKVISFCLWGSEPCYNVGAIKNAQLAKKFYPDFICWFYIHFYSVPIETINTLQRMDNVRVILRTCEEIYPNRFMSWRFEPLDDPFVELFISRDTDTRILQREVLAVKEWLNSNKTLHIMRDSPCHYPLILGGMFGLRKIPNLKIREKINEYFSTHTEHNDQQFIRDVIYPLVKNNCMVHDEIKKYEGNACLPFPIKYDLDLHFVGEYVYEDETRSEQYVNIQRQYITTFLPHRIEGRFQLQKCIVACDLNETYTEFFPLVKKCWKDVVGLNTVLILIADKIPLSLSIYKKDIVLFPPIEGIHPAFQAQCIRILYPALMNVEGAIITSDMDLIPLNRVYYINNVINQDPESFIVYRDCISEHKEYPVCFCAAYSKVWKDIFHIDSLEDIRRTIKEWYTQDYALSSASSDGWAMDQKKLYEFLNKWKGARTGKVILLKDKNTGFNRLDRIHMNEVMSNKWYHRRAIQQGLRSDFHLPKPYKIHSQNIHFLIGNIVNVSSLVQIDFSQLNLIDNVYIMHYSKLKDRRKFMEEQLSRSGISKRFKITWITQFDRENITEDMIRENYKYDPQILSRKITLPEIANGIAHNHIIERISQYDETALILEDDIVFCPNFLYFLAKCLSLAPTDWEILTLGGHYIDSLNKYTEAVKDGEDIVVKKPNKICTTVSCYMLRPGVARKIINHHLFKPFSTPIDETLVHILPDISPNLYWCIPWLATEGSKEQKLFSQSLGRGF